MCGSKVVDEARFCPQCGFALPRTPAQEKQKPVERPSASEQAAADPFSHTVPADPKELDRIRDMIAQKQQGPAVAVAVAAVPIRERTLGTTKAIEAVEEQDPP